MATSDYTADRRLYLDAEGNVVEADNPARITLLVREGGTLSAADAERYGLKSLDSAPATKAVTEAPENKSAKAPTATKTSAKKG